MTPETEEQQPGRSDQDQEPGGDEGVKAPGRLGGSIITASDIARERGCHRTTAWRWLRSLEQRGPQFAFRRRIGGRMVLVTTRAVQRQLAQEHLADVIDRLEPRVRELEEQGNDLTKRLDAGVSQAKEFQRKSNEWFKRLERLEETVRRQATRAR